MRRSALRLAILVGVSVLGPLVPAAFAHPRHPATKVTVKAPARGKKVAAEPVRGRDRKRSGKLAAVSPKKVKRSKQRALTEVAPVRKGRRRREAAPEPTSVKRVKGSWHKGPERAVATKMLNPKALESPKVQARVARPAEIPEPEAVPTGPIEVHHNRHAHPAPNSLVTTAAVTSESTQIEVKEAPLAWTRRGGMPMAMRGSHEILLHQNAMADADGLERVLDDDALLQMRDNKSLVAIPAVAGLQTDGRLPADRRFTRPWTAQFLSALAKAHYSQFHTALQVNSAVRTVAFQQRLLRTNGNAAPAAGETASPHLTGQAVDLAKKGLSLSEVAWMRGYLLPLVQEGKIDVEEEFQQACFHISVYKRYVPAAVAAPKKEIAEGHHSGAGTVVAALP